MALKNTTSCLGYQQITSLATAASLTVPTGAVMAVVVPETQGVRWRDDLTDPTAVVGMPLAAGGVLEYDGNLRNIRFIQQAASAVLNISYCA
jgi:hypothetical protein